MLSAYVLGLLPSDVVDAAAVDALRVGAQSYVSTYDEYSVGSWALAPLWSDSTGDSTGASREHNEAARPIAAAAGLDGINHLVRAHFDTDKLRTVRLVRASHGALIIPHIDYLEHEYGFTRVHVPLVTDSAQARSVEDNICFHMRRGEVWFLNARKIHSGGVVGSSVRIHLVLDFDHAVRPVDTVTKSLSEAAPPLLIDRPSLPTDLVPSYQALAPYIDAAGWRDLVHLIARVHLRYHVPAGALYDWLEDMAQESAQPDRDFLEKDARRMRRYFLTTGPRATLTYGAFWDTVLADYANT